MHCTFKSEAWQCVLTGEELWTWFAKSQNSPVLYCKNFT